MIKAPAHTFYEVEKIFLLYLITKLFTNGAFLMTNYGRIYKGSKDA